MFHRFITALCLLCSMSLLAQKNQKSSFRIVPLGVKGGIDETNLSAYMVAANHSDSFICLDAGTLRAGIEKAIAAKTFQASASTVLKKYIKAYFISHAHLDHVSGLIINSPDDSNKTVYALPGCMQMMENHYFNGDTWANFGDEGKGYQIKKYHFETLVPNTEINVPAAGLHVTPFVLSHVNPYESTAFLVRYGNNYLLYLGDTGPDSIEQSNKLKLLWQAVAPLIKSKQLKGIFVEVSFANEQPDKSLFGHLTPKWFTNEMKVLSSSTGEAVLAGFPVVITHVKPPALNEQRLKKQLLADNPCHLRLIFPVQGAEIKL